MESRAEMKENLDQYKNAYEDSFPYYWDETVLLDAYVRKLVATMSGHRDVRALSLGIGRQIVSRALFENIDLKEYHVVEGSPAIIEAYKEQASPPDVVRLHNAYFEDVEFDQPFDLIEMGFVLEHVDDPALILRRFHRFLSPNGLLFVSVPNARSLHRLLGHAAGLMPDIYALSQADRELGHKRYFDSKSFTTLVEDCGYRVRARHGLMLKPLTTGQIHSLGMGDRLDEALIKVGYELPEIANGILIEASPR
jgi:2-polyprenyl-3-methyl-5-hydroxy-6-metoxy-1,4-benzoquinol methylase